MSVDLSKMIEKRREVLGEGDKFDVTLGDQQFWIIAPELATAEFNDQFENMKQDAADGLLSSSDLRADALALFLGDSADAFATATETAGIDGFALLQWALEEHAAEVRRNPTRPTSRNTPKRAKRR